VSGSGGIVTEWPREWPVGRSGVFATTVLFGLVTVACVVAVATDSADPVAIVLGLCAPFPAGLTLLGYRRVRVRGGRGFRVDPDAGALTVPFAIPVCIAAWLIIVGGVTAGGAIAVLSLTGPVSVGSLVLGVLLALIGLYALAFVAEALLGHLRRGALTLTARGITWRGWGSDVSVEWEQVLSADPLPRSTSQTIAVSCYSGVAPTYRYRSLLWRPLRRTGTVLGYLPVGGSLLAADPALVLAALRFYLANPVARTELGTDAALRRVTRD
jgi:hypothetical protein